MKFHNDATEAAVLSWIPLEGAGRTRLVQVRNIDEWQSLVQSLDVKELVLRDPLSSGLGGESVNVGDKLMTIGSALDRGFNGTESLRKMVLYDGTPTFPFPAHIGFRPSTLSPIHAGDVQAKSMLSQDTSAGHRFAIEIPGFEVREVVVKSSGKVRFRAKDGWGISVTGEALYEDALENQRAGPRWESHLDQMREECERAFVGHADEAKYFCSHDDRLHVTSAFDHTDQFWEKLMKPKTKERLRRNRLDPRGVHNFTDVGFEVRATPEDVLTELRQFYMRDRLKANPENHPFDDPNLSGRESDTWLLGLPNRLKNKVIEAVKPIVAEWSGLPIDELEMTAAYGIRLYHSGSILRRHVDRIDTHILSAIIEIEHLGVEGAEGNDENGRRSWPLQIMDHAGKEHNVPDNAGQLILYESSTCAHGRETPFRGREMANVFVHFKPKGWPKKFFGRRENEL